MRDVGLGAEYLEKIEPLLVAYDAQGRSKATSMIGSQ